MNRAPITAKDALRHSIEDKLLEFAALWDEVTTSDLQGMAEILANQIILQVRES